MVFVKRFVDVVILKVSSIKPKANKGTNHMILLPYSANRKNETVINPIAWYSRAKWSERQLNEKSWKRNNNIKILRTHQVIA